MAWAPLRTRFSAPNQGLVMFEQGAQCQKKPPVHAGGKVWGSILKELCSLEIVGQCANRRPEILDDDVGSNPKHSDEGSEQNQLEISGSVVWGPEIWLLVVLHPKPTWERIPWPVRSSVPRPMMKPNIARRPFHCSAKAENPNFASSMKRESDNPSFVTDCFAMPWICARSKSGSPSATRPRPKWPRTIPVRPRTEKVVDALVVAPSTGTNGQRLPATPLDPEGACQSPADRCQHRCLCRTSAQ